MIFTSYAGNTIIPLRPTAALIEPVITRNRLFLNFWPHLGVFFLHSALIFIGARSIGKRCSRGKKGPTFDRIMRAITGENCSFRIRISISCQCTFTLFCVCSYIIPRCYYCVYRFHSEECTVRFALEHSLNRLLFLISQFIIKVIDTKIILLSWNLKGEGKLSEENYQNSIRYFITRRCNYGIYRRNNNRIFSRSFYNLSEIIQNFFTCLLPLLSRIIHTLSPISIITIIKYMQNSRFIREYREDRLDHRAFYHHGYPTQRLLHALQKRFQKLHKRCVEARGQRASR